MAGITRRGVAFDRQTLQADSTKAAGPAIGVDNYSSIVFFIRYTRGGVGGAMKYIIQFSNDKVNWYDSTEVQAPAIVPGSDVVLVTQRAITRYQATTGAEERFSTPTYAKTGQWMRISPFDDSLNPGIAYVEYEVNGQN